MQLLYHFGVAMDLRPVPPFYAFLGTALMDHCGQGLYLSWERRFKDSPSFTQIHHLIIQWSLWDLCRWMNEIYSAFRSVQVWSNDRCRERRLIIFLHEKYNPDLIIVKLYWSNKMDNVRYFSSLTFVRLVASGCPAISSISMMFS